jgi:hypothetical protein
MRYPHYWRAFGDVYAESHRDKGKDRVYTLHMRVDRPGTPDHTRRIIAVLNHAELQKLQKEIEYQLTLQSSEAEGGMYGSVACGEEEVKHGN